MIKLVVIFIVINIINCFNYSRVQGVYMVDDSKLQKENSKLKTEIKENVQNSQFSIFKQTQNVCIPIIPIYSLTKQYM